MDEIVNNIRLAWKLACMLKTYRTCNPTVRFPKYEFNNKLLSGVILLIVTACVTWTQPYIYIYIYIFFFYEKYWNFIEKKKRISYIASWNTRGSRKGGLSFIKVTNSLIPLACHAKVCVAWLASRFICWNWVRRKAWDQWRVPPMISTIETWGVMVPHKALKTSFEFVLNITSLTPTSHAKETASSAAFALASNGPSGSGKCLLKAAITDPSWSCIITPMSMVWRFEKIAASMLTLYHGCDGVIQQGSACSLKRGRAGWASWKSSRMERALWIISWQVCLVEPSLVLLRLYHMHHATVIMSSTKSFPMCCIKIRYQRRSINSLKLTPLASKDIPLAKHTSRALVQSQNKCPLVSSAWPHASQVALSITPRWQRFTFVGGCCGLLSMQNFLVC